MIKVSGREYDNTFNEASKIVTYLKSHLKDIILGPSSSAMPKINNIYYVQVIIKYKNTKDIMKDILFIKDRYKKGKINVDIDLNPIKI